MAMTRNDEIQNSADPHKAPLAAAPIESRTNNSATKTLTKDARLRRSSPKAARSASMT